MYVEIEENKCEGMVRLRDITDDFYTLDEKNYAIIGQRKEEGRTSRSWFDSAHHDKLMTNRKM